MIAKLIERARKGPKYRYRRSDTGKFCTALYALLHPDTTYRVQVR